VAPCLWRAAPNLVGGARVSRRVPFADSDGNLLCVQVGSAARVREAGPACRWSRWSPSRTTLSDSEFLFTPISVRSAFWGLTDFGACFFPLSQGLIREARRLNTVAEEVIFVTNLGTGCSIFIPGSCRSWCR